MCFPVPLRFHNIHNDLQCLRGALTSEMSNDPIISTTPGTCSGDLSVASNVTVIDSKACNASDRGYREIFGTDD